MAKSASPYEFEVPWRPNFEARMAIVWSLGAVSISPGQLLVAPLARLSEATALYQLGRSRNRRSRQSPIGWGGAFPGPTSRPPSSIP